jgi:outer membrane autotransporter protein
LWSHRAFLIGDRLFAQRDASSIWRGYEYFLPIKEVGEAHGCLFCDPAKAKSVFAPFCRTSFFLAPSISAGLYSKRRSMVSRSSGCPRDIKTRRNMKGIKFTQQPAIPSRIFAAAAFTVSLLALTTNHNASAQSVLTPPITFFQTFATSNNQLRLANSLDRILDQQIATGQSTLVSTPTGLVLTAPTGTLPLFVLTQLDRELGPNVSNPAFLNPAVRRVLIELAPNLYTDLPYITFDNTHTVYNSLESRMAEIRSDYIEVVPIPTQPYAPEGKSGLGKEVKNPVAPPPVIPEQKWGFFAMGNGKFGELDSDGNGLGFKYQSGGVVVGADYKLLPKLAIGIAGGYEYTNLDPKFVGGLGSANSGYGALFATYGGSSGIYAEAIGAVGYTTYAIQRDVLGTSAHGYPDGWDASVGGTLGYLVKLTDNIGVAPFGKIFYDHLWRSGASETGSIAGLDVKHGSADSLQTVVGGKLVATFNLGPVRLNNEMWAGYRHEYLETQYAVASRFLDGGVNIFTTRSPRFHPDSIVGGVGTNAEITRCWSVNFNYNVEANDTYYGHEFLWGLKYKF